MARRLAGRAGALHPTVYYTVCQRGRPNSISWRRRRWNSWPVRADCCTVVGWRRNHFKCNISDALIRQTADAMVSSGLRDKGYRYSASPPRRRARHRHPPPLCESRSQPAASQRLTAVWPCCLRAADPQSTLMTAGRTRRATQSPTPSSRTLQSFLTGWPASPITCTLKASCLGSTQHVAHTHARASQDRVASRILTPRPLHPGR